MIVKIEQRAVRMRPPSTGPVAVAIPIVAPKMPSALPYSAP